MIKYYIQSASTSSLLLDSSSSEESLLELLCFNYWLNLSIWLWSWFIIDSPIVIISASLHFFYPFILNDITNTLMLTNSSLIKL